MKSPEFTHTITISSQSEYGGMDLSLQRLEPFISKLSEVIGDTFSDGRITTYVMIASSWKRVVPLLTLPTQEKMEFDVCIPIEKNNRETIKEIFKLFSKSPLASVAFMSIAKKSRVHSPSVETQPPFPYLN